MLRGFATKHDAVQTITKKIKDAVKKTESKGNNGSGNCGAHEKVENDVNKYLRALRERKSGRRKSGFRKPLSSSRKLSFLRAPVAASSSSFKYHMDSKTLHYEALEVPGQPPVPSLANDLDRTLFNPGVQFLKDPRTNVYNFDEKLENIMSIQDFDFSTIPAYVPSSKDNTLAQLASKHNKKYTGSTSSLTSVLTQIHFMLSHERPPQLMSLSKFFPAKVTTFSSAQRAPTSFFLRYNKETQTYSVNSDSTDADEMILTLLGQAMETMLVTDATTFTNYDKNKAHLLTDDERNLKNTYHYTQCGSFLMRSQLDCFDPRLPGTGMFDLKTRAVCAVRYDIDYAQIHDGSNYQILKRDGMYESYSRELYELIRSALFKYSLQARIGRMDGIFVAYHNIRNLFGFEYMPLGEIDKVFHSSHLLMRKRKPGVDLDLEMSEVAPIIADTEFKLSMTFLTKLLDEILDTAPKENGNEAFNIVVHCKGPGTMVVFVKPMLDKDITATAMSVDTDTTYAANADPFTIFQHAKARPDRTPPDLIALKVECLTKMNGRVVSPRHYPAMSNADDQWEVSFNISKMSRSEADESYKQTTKDVSWQELTSTPLIERPQNAELAREVALEKLPDPSSFQEMLRKLDEKGRKYKEWDMLRKKTRWVSCKTEV